MIKGLDELLKKYKESTDMTADQFNDELNKLLPTEWKPANVYNELNEKYKLLEGQKNDVDKLLKEANDAKTASDEFKGKYEDLLKTQKADKEKYEADLAANKKNFAIDLALTKAGARNNTAVRALLDMGKISLDNNGAVLGINEQIDALKKDNDYLFGVQQGSSTGPKPSFGSGNGGSNPPAVTELEAQINAAMGI